MTRRLAETSCFMISARPESDSILALGEIEDWRKTRICARQQHEYR